MIGLLDGLIVGRRSGRTTSRGAQRAADGVDHDLRWCRLSRRTRKWCRLSLTRSRRWCRLSRDHEEDPLGVVRR
jgi:hypothetical protein